MYWYVYIFEGIAAGIILAVVVVGLVGVVAFCISTNFWRDKPRKWLYRAGFMLIFVVISLFAVLLMDITTDVGENIILMKIKNNEPTGKVLTGDENRGLVFFRTDAFMKSKDRIEGNRSIKTADGKDINLLITAVVAVENPNKVFYAWKDSVERPNSSEEANENILDLISEQYMDAMNYTTFEDLEKDCINDGIESVLKKNGLELLDMKVLLRLPDKLLGEIKSTILLQKENQLIK